MLEEFFVPNILDWSVPPDVKKVLVTRRPPKMFKGIVPDWNQKSKNWGRKVDQAIERAVNGLLKDSKILQHSLTAYAREDILEDKLKRLGETDMIHFTPSYGAIFRMLFSPSPPVQQALQSISSELGLVQGEYTAIHLRVRYPRGLPLERQNILLGKDPNAPDADHGGLLWSGAARNYAIQQATHAIRCSKRLLRSPTEKVYMISDSNDLVRYFAHEIKGSKKGMDSKIDLEAVRQAHSMNIVARDMSAENFHLDRQKGKNASDYYSTFLDLLLASRARCVAYGVGRYGLFAAKISGTKCQIWYQREAYGEEPGKGHNAAFCPME